MQRYVRTDRLQANAATRDDRYLARARILSCWKRETPQQLAYDGTPIGYELDLSGLRLPSLPDLEADFSHVGSLKLSGMGLSASPRAFSPAIATRAGSTCPTTGCANCRRHWVRCAASHACSCTTTVYA